MPTVEIPLIGAMDGDTPSETFVKGTHRSASNIIFRGNKGNMRGEPLPGTRLIPFSLPAGTNVTIGRYYDSIGSRVLWFNYNSNGNHGIYSFNYIPETIQTLLQVGIGTLGDPLGFLPTVTINSINIIYGDSGAGDILCFVDSLLRPTKINIQRYISNTYPTVIRSYLDVAKAPPQMPSRVGYENDTTIKINNLRNSLFQFKYRFVFDDNEKSVWSTGSILPLPNQSSLQLTNTDFTLNSRISVNITTGDIDVTKIELAGRQVKDGSTSDWFLINSFNKSQLSIPNNDIYTFRFYNDGIYNFIDINESILLQDYVPQTAKCQELLNGNVLSYAGITEGYNLLNPTIQVNILDSASQRFYDMNGLLFFAQASGIDSGSTGTTLKIYLYGTGTNDGSGNVTTLNNSKGTFVINAINTGTVASIGTSVTTVSDSNTVSSILTSVSTGLVGNGWVQTSLVGNILIMSYAAGFTLYSSGVKLDQTGSNITQTSLVHAYDSAYDLGIAYFDAKGRTNQVITNISGTLNTPATTGSAYPQVQLQISHRPPLWASYYQIVRTPNLTYSKRFYWVSKSAYSDGALTGSNTRFAYIGIDNIQFYNDQITQAQGTPTGIISYGFTPGDRIKFLNRYDFNGAVANTLSLDYEIIGTVINPIVAGIQQYGVFIKIYYPIADISANFGFDGTTNYQNYNIFIYNYSQHTTKANNVYFEFGKCFGIGNAGTVNAYHIGLDQTQTSNLATPALITISNGDYFYRQRSVPIGNTFVLQSTQSDNGFVYLSPGFNISTATTTASYTVQTSTFGQANTLAQGTGDYTAGKAFFLNNSVNGIKIRIRSSNMPFAVDGQTSTSLYFQAVNSDGTFQLITILQPVSMVGGQTYNLSFDSTIIVQPNARIHLIIQNSSQVVNQHVYPFYITVDVIANINIPIIETSFSDVYKLISNSDSRPMVIDPNARQTYFSTLFRFSRPYQLGTNINDTNRFYPNNFDEFKKDYGDVVRMLQMGKELKVFQYRRTGRLGIYSKFIKNNQQETQLVVSDTIITQNNIEYYVGDFGIGNQPDGLSQDGYRFYFPDPVKGFLLRESQDGIEIISETFKQQTWAGSNIPNYLTNHAYAYGGNAKILGTFNFKKDKQGECIFVLQAGTGVTGYTIAFDEQNKCFTSYYDFNPDAILCIENKLISWRGGALYVHDDTVNVNTFYGTKYPSKLEIILTDGLATKKDFVYMGYVSPINSPWTAPNTADVTTSFGNQSSLQTSDFENREGVWHTAFARDSTSPGGEINGDFLKGQWIDVKLQNNSTFFTYIYGIYLSFLESQKNM